MNNNNLILRLILKVQFHHKLDDKPDKINGIPFLHQFDLCQLHTILINV